MNAWKILIVDDDQMIVELLTLRLQAKGFEVQSALNGEAAYTVAEQFQPHLILCDLVMPIVDGPTFCRRMRSEGIETPFLFLTAKGQPRDKIDVLSAGADGYLVKPFEAKELLAHIQAILRRHYPAAA